MEMKLFAVGDLPEDYQPTKDEQKLLDFINQTDGNIAAVARCCKMSRRAIYNRIHKSSFLQMVINETRETLHDDAELELGKAVRRGEGWAVCFILKTKGRSRGYVEKNELNVNARSMTVADLVRGAAAELAESCDGVQEVEVYNDGENE